ncbi:MAG: hypothetical protein ACK5XN_21705 [Bacteroidota bacterium]|jgi:hypothetical protein
MTKSGLAKKFKQSFGEYLVWLEDGRWCCGKERDSRITDVIRFDDRASAIRAAEMLQANGEDFEEDSPTAHAPGTEEKMFVMQLRAAMGYSVFHRLDYRPDIS